MMSRRERQAVRIALEFLMHPRVIGAIDEPVYPTQPGLARPMHDKRAKVCALLDAAERLEGLLPDEGYTDDWFAILKTEPEVTEFGGKRALRLYARPISHRGKDFEIIVTEETEENLLHVGSVVLVSQITLCTWDNRGKPVRWLIQACDVDNVSRADGE